MKPIQLTIITLFMLVMAGCRGSEKVSHDQWILSFKNGITIRHGATTVAHGLFAEYALDGRMVSTHDYKQHRFMVDDISDQFGNGKKWSIVYTDDHLPTLTQSFYIYPDYLLTDISLTAERLLSTNYMAPVVVPQTDSCVQSHHRQHLFVPYDNDAWIRYHVEQDNADTLRSYEVTAVYAPATREGVVIGAVDHTLWKNAIDLTDHYRQLKAFSGVADSLTRDRMPHGQISGLQVQSARFFIGHFGDWRQGLEAYAAVNALIAPPRQWAKAMPVGWNSWGALAFGVNHESATQISNFLARELQGRSFCTSEGLLYTGLDSGWNNFSESELRDFADCCQKNHQVPCIYWTPFTDWAMNPDRKVPGAGQYRYRDIYLYANGQPQELDGAYAIDPTHPAVKAMMEQTAELFRRCGYRYAKMDFMTHGRMEADRWYRAGITTGTQAYNYGMQLLDSIFADMYINLSISPVFPAQYAQSRRIACDAWNKMKDTEYTLNALSWGWWIDRIYQYNDADHVVLREASEGENRARITSSVITGLYITGDDFSADTLAMGRALRYLTNTDINRLATGRSFRPLTGSDARSEHVFVRTEDHGVTHVAVFNYGDEPLSFHFDRQQLGLDEQARYAVVELWSHEATTLDAGQTIPAKDVKVFRLTRI